MEYTFKAKIYQTGINWCVDVPLEITNSLIATQGRINIKRKINEFNFIKTLMRVKNESHRLFLNREMIKGGKTALGQMAILKITQNTEKKIKKNTIPFLLMKHLAENELSSDFEKLTASKKRALLKYFSYIKTEETLLKNTNKLIIQLRNKEKNIRIP